MDRHVLVIIYRLTQLWPRTRMWSISFTTIDSRFATPGVDGAQHVTADHPCLYGTRWNKPSGDEGVSTS